MMHSFLLILSLSFECYLNNYCGNITTLAGEHLEMLDL